MFEILGGKMFLANISKDMHKVHAKLKASTRAGTGLMLRALGVRTRLKQRVEGRLGG